MAAYCTASDVQIAAGKTLPLSPYETTAVAGAITQAQQIIEKATGTFFDQRYLQVTTEAVQPRQKRIFLPAPCISFDSNQITENGSTLTLGQDFLLYQPNVGGTPTGPGWIEKDSQASGTWDFLDSRGALFWTRVQQAIVMSGQFGYASVPADVTKVTAWKAAEILGWVTIDYTDGGGVSKAVLKNGMPDWANAILRGRSLSPLDEQYFGITVLM